MKEDYTCLRFVQRRPEAVNELCDVSRAFFQRDENRALAENKVEHAYNVRVGQPAQGRDFADSGHKSILLNGQIVRFLVIVIQYSGPSTAILLMAAPYRRESNE